MTKSEMIALLRSEAAEKLEKAKPKRCAGYEWLDNFNGYTKSGLSYTEYQRREQGWR